MARWWNGGKEGWRDGRKERWQDGEVGECMAERPGGGVVGWQKGGVEGGGGESQSHA